MNQILLGVFHNQSEAQNALTDLEGLGYDPKNISIVMKDHQETKVVDATGNKAASGAVSGATTGGVIGAIGGLLVGLGTIVIPGIGGLLIGGPLAAALGLTGAAATTVSGAVTGSVAGGLLGGLIGLGLPEETAKYYQDSIEQGGILIAVPVDEDSNINEARAILTEHEADQIKIIDDQQEIETTDSENTVKHFHD